MKTYTKEELREVLARHTDWLRGDLGGACADLADARLTGADLVFARLARANLRGADLTDANLSGADLAFARLDLEVPIVPDIDRVILEAVGPDGDNLDMETWHCGTSHCRAGWAIHKAGEAGYALERAVGPDVAGALIYHASAGYVPDFYASNDEALADIRRRAEGA
jgi:hypothetical protein